MATLRPERRSAGETSAPTRVTGGRYRPEIQGLRAVSVLLVAVYHIWFGRVSGGVDVFLLLTGFLITGSLLRTVERRGAVAFGAFWARLAKRLLPPAAVVLAGILAATWLVLPPDRWRETIGEIIASALYYQNWQLSLNSVDYLAQNNVASPAQHFWSLSIQGQFYLLCPVLVALAAGLAARRGWSPKRVLLGALAALFVVSLSYSVLVTEVNQQWAYFDTGARLWEFALGGALAIVLDRLSVARSLRIAMGWLGLAALASCGILLQVSTVFPGYAALWPTLAAVLVIVAGSTGSPFAVDRLLNCAPMHYIGNISYALYLWHWPILVCYLTVTDRSVPSLVGGSAVLAVSIVLAAATTWLTDNGLERLTRTRTTPMWSLAVGLVFILPVVTAGAGWSTYLAEQQRERAELAADPTKYPGAAAGENGGENYPELPVYPSPEEAAEDLPVTYENECNQGTTGTEVHTCEYGADDPERTIALVGGSHAAHWFPALEVIAEENNWSVVNITKGACLFTEAPQTYKGEEYTACATWNQGVLEELERIRPDAVFTTATSTSLDSEGQNGGDGEGVVEGYPERWAELDRLGIDVIAVRDTPRFGFDTASCLATKDAAECGGQRGRSMADEPPYEELAGVPDNVAFIDLTDHLCEGDECPAVIGNVLVYWDGSHMTATFMRTMAPVLEPRLKDAVNW
ncbi:peptidoglycan/LPS O-acetylase OafA/YrhL [Lipingzhangella halophila]|uniref:Peptidoglycan/LPS O-acetylase OafA/YrhL n=1 Tax=Lipingzhangella halophila TaxID=1783352 RepID=A0A7W7W5L0_9ACTN|nr:acyltransferase family protein [Lipingzhangella halophila]MBB4933900.1 peptidoglycan/LPS O-acetylase OafA/YrhL [Lipingzhangella halophila]